MRQTIGFISQGEPHISSLLIQNTQILFSSEQSHNTSFLAAATGRCSSIFFQQGHILRDPGFFGQNFSSGGVVPFPRHFCIGQIVRDLLFLCLNLAKPRNATITCNGSIIPDHKENIIADIMHQTVNCLRKKQNIYLIITSSVDFYFYRLTKSQHKVSNFLWASSLSLWLKLNRFISNSTRKRTFDQPFATVPVFSSSASAFGFWKERK